MRTDGGRGTLSETIVYYDAEKVVSMFVKRFLI